MPPSFGDSNEVLVTTTRTNRRDDVGNKVIWPSHALDASQRQRKTWNTRHKIDDACDHVADVGWLDFRGNKSMRERWAPKRGRVTPGACRRVRAAHIAEARVGDDRETQRVCAVRLGDARARRHKQRFAQVEGFDDQVIRVERFDGEAPEDDPPCRSGWVVQL